MNGLKDLIKQARIQNSLSLEVVADSLQIPIQSLHDFEEGRASIDADVLFGLVNMLNIAPEAVLPLISQIGWDVANFESDADVESLFARGALEKAKA